MKIQKNILFITLLVHLSCGDSNGLNASLSRENQTEINNTLENDAKFFFTIVQNLRIREHPNLRSEVIATMPLNSKVKYLNEETHFIDTIELRGIEYKEPWIKIEYQKQVGWVYKGGVDEDEQASILETTNYIDDNTPELYCSRDNAILISTIYSTSIPLFTPHEEFKKLINDNAVSIDSDCITCMKKIGEALIMNSIDARIVSRETRGRLGGNDLDKLLTDMVVMGEEINWLAEVIPYAIEGNWSYYHARPTKLGQSLKLFGPMLDLSDIQPYMGSIKKTTSLYVQELIENSGL